MNQRYTLSQFCGLIKERLENDFQDSYWVTAEILSFSERTHAYFELAQKGSDGLFEARVRATCWANKYSVLSRFFKEQTGCALAEGMQVLVEVYVEFHAVYGLSLEIVGIDPTFTLGDLARQKQQTIQKLMLDGVMDMNKSLPLPSLIKRIAVISSSGAAGYEDFRHQLEHNEWGLAFQLTLFNAVMQGDNAEASIIGALTAVQAREQDFDLVVIIRGGGATGDLRCFDGYNVAFHCANFPLPILSGIGHTRDVSVVDMVANVSVKTPTDAAQAILNHNRRATERLFALQDRFGQAVRYFLQSKQRHVEQLYNSVLSLWKGKILYERNKLVLLEKQIEIFSPEAIYRKGYALITRDGAVVRSVEEVREGDRIKVEMLDGKFAATVEATDSNAPS